ncbi:hypothetical protein SRHO_G00084640 [Serrasalmus rhombeus]
MHVTGPSGSVAMEIYGWRAVKEDEALEVAIVLSLYDTTHRDGPLQSSSSDQLAKEALEDSQAGDPEKSLKNECPLKDTRPQRTTTIIKKDSNSDSSSCPADDESKNPDNMSHSMKPKKSQRHRQKAATHVEPCSLFCCGSDETSACGTTRL